MEWHYIKSGKQEGPVTEAKIKELISSGKIESSDLVWKVGLDKWIPATEAFPDFTPPPLDSTVQQRQAQIAHQPLPTNSTHTVSSESKKGNYFSRHWRGELSLGISYWVNGLLANIVLMVIILFFSGLAASNSSNYNFVFYWFGIYTFAFGITIWQLTGVWRSADNHIERTNRRFWPTAAKVAVVLGLLRFIGDFLGTGLPAIQESIKQGEWLTKNAKWEINLLRNGTEVELRGGIGRGISIDLEKILNAAPNVKLVHINLGMGGLVEEGQKLNAMIRDRRLATYTSSECVSACSIAFMGGTERYLKSGAKLGFHAYKVPGVSPSETDYSESKRFLISSGISSEFADKIFKTPHDSMWYPEPPELLRHGVITAIVSGDEFGLSGFQRKGLEVKLESELLASKLYKAIHDREPELFRMILVEMQEAIHAGKSIGEIRTIVSPHVSGLRVKYLPYASDESVKALADYLAQATKAVRSAPSICLKYLRDGEPQATNSALRMYPPGLAEKELDLLAEVIQSADFSRSMPTKAEKDKLLNAVLEKAMKLLGDRASIIAELGNPKPDPASWCDSFFAVYLAVASMPPNQARVATLALSE